MYTLNYSMRKIRDIYSEYKIMPNLQMHQYRVAAVAKQICDSLTIPVEEHAVITACLLHDMGNIIKFDLNYFPEFNKPEGTEYWQSVKDHFVAKYGHDEHHATLEIVEELGFPKPITNLIDAIDHTYLENNKDTMSLEEKICIYVDNRVDPHKVVSIHERGEEGRNRYKNHKNRIEEESHLLFMKNLEDLEKLIFSHSNIKADAINDESVAKIIEELKNFEI